MQVVQSVNNIPKEKRGRSGWLTSTAMLAVLLLAGGCCGQKRHQRKGAESPESKTKTALVERPIEQVSLFPSSVSGKDIVEILKAHYGELEAAGDLLGRGRSGSYAAWLKELKTKTPEQVFAALDKLNEGVEDNGWSDSREEIKRILQGAEFTSIRQALLLDTSQGSLQPAAAVVFSLLRDDAVSKRKNIDALQSPEFRKFTHLLANDYRLDVYGELDKLLRLYNDPIARRFFESPHTLAAFSSLKEKFPEVDFHKLSEVRVLHYAVPLETFSDRGIPEGVLTETVQEIERIKTFDSKVRDSCGFSAKTPDDIRVLFDFTPEQQALLINGSSFWDYLKSKGSPMSSPSDYHQLHETLEGLDSFFNGNLYVQSPRELDELLKPFGISFSDLGVEDLDQLKPVLPQLKQLIKDKDFLSYLAKLKENFPDIEFYLNYQGAAYLLSSFEKRSHIFEFNAEANNFFEGEIECPYLESTDIELKTSLLKGLAKLEGFSLGLTTDYEADSEFASLILGADSEDDLQYLMGLIEKGAAQELADSFRESWGVEILSVAGFVEILLDDDERAFFLDSRNRKKIAVIEEKFGLQLPSQIMPGDFSAEDAESAVGILKEFGPFLVDFSERENLERAAVISAKYFFPQLVRPDRSLAQALHPRDLFELFEESLGLCDLDEFEAAAANLRVLGIDSQNIGRLLRRANIDEDFQSWIASEEFKSDYNWLLRRVYQGNSKKYADNAVHNLFKMRETGSSEWKETLEACDALGWDFTGIMPWVTFNAFVASDEKITENLLDPEFAAFYKRVGDTVFKGAFSLRDIRFISEAYDYAKANSAAAEVLFRSSFEEARLVLNERMQVANFLGESLVPLMHAACAIEQDREAFYGVMDELEADGEVLDGADLVVVADLARNPELLVQYRNEALLNKTLEEVYQGEMLERKHKDKAERLKFFISKFKERGDEAGAELLQAQLDSFLSEYTERPPIDSIPRYDKFIIHRVVESFQNPDFLKTLGQIAWMDIHDKTTEYGGVGIGMPPGKGILLNGLQSHSEEDGKYDSEREYITLPGWLLYHLHALKVSQNDWAGASGGLSRGEYRADLGVADYNRMANLVFTTLGHPKDEQGRELKGKIRIGVDYYRVFDVDSKRRDLKVDLGILIVDYKEPKD